MPIAPAALSSRVQTGIASFRAPVAAPSRGSLQVMAASKKKDVRLTITLECTEQKASGVPGMSRYMSQKVRAASVEPEASSRASSRGVPGADKDAFSRETLSPGALVVSRANAPRGTGAPRTRPSARRGPSPAPRHIPLDASRARTPSSPPPTPPERELTSPPPLHPSSNAEPPQHLRAPGADEVQPLPSPTHPPPRAQEVSGVLPSAGAWWVGVGRSRDGTGSAERGDDCFRFDSFVGV